MIRALVAVLCAASMLIAGTAAASDWSEKDVQKVVEKKKEGRSFLENGEANSQVVVLRAEGVSYVVDLKTQLCFFGPRTAGAIPAALTAIPCAAMKKGFPMFAPLITWEP